MKLKVTFLLFWTSVVLIAEPGKNSSEESPLYKAVGKRDPFKKPSSSLEGRSPDSLNELERYPLEQLELRAILRGLGKPKALFQDPTGSTHIVESGTKVGREGATISRILNSDVIVTERTFNYLGQESLYERVISLPVDDKQ